MSNIKIHEQLTLLRKQKELTQEELAQVFGVTNQSVSKWESGACCPDISLLPDIADFFGVSIDTLFGKIPVSENEVMPVTWEDDNTIRAVVFLGKKIISDLDKLSKFTFHLEGEIKNVECRCSLNCGDIQGNVTAGCDVNCGDIGGNASAGCDINCGDIEGNAIAGCDISCGNIVGDANAGCEVNCGNVGGVIS